MTKLDKFTLVTGSIGLLADTITILGAIGGVLILPNFSNIRIVSAAFDSLVLFTGLLGLYSLTMIIWFLLRRKTLNPENAMFGFDELSLWRDKAKPGSYFYREPHDSTWELIQNLIPIIGAFTHIIAHKSARVIFFIGVFVSLFPTIFWLYLLFSQTSIAALFGVFLSFLLAQYSTFFALVLDKFSKSVYVDFSK